MFTHYFTYLFGTNKYIQMLIINNTKPTIGYTIIFEFVVPYISRKPFIKLPKTKVVILALYKLLAILDGIFILHKMLGTITPIINGIMNAPNMYTEYTW